MYWVARRLFELVVLRLRSERSKELEILVLRHQLHVLQRQVGRPRLRPADRLLLAALSRSLPRPAWSSFFVSPVTLLRWHRQLVARRWTYPRRSVGRPRTDRGRCELVLRMARENPTWGYRRTRQQVDAQLRRGLPLRGYARDPHTSAGAESEGARRALGGQPAA